METTSVDDALSLLSHHHRRWTLQYLRAVSGNQVSVETLADHLESRARRNAAVDTPDHEHLMARLHHVHLPKLLEYDLVEFDVPESTIQYTGTKRVESVLDGVPSEPSVASN